MTAWLCLLFAGLTNRERKVMPEYLDRAEAADYLTGRGLKIKKGTLQKYATTGGGPPIGALATKQSIRPTALTNGLRGK
jgi:hypothetical protein